MLSLGGVRTRIKIAGLDKLLAVLFSSSVLTIAIVATVPYTSYDFPPQVLFDDFLPQTEMWDYNPRIERGSWLILEVTSDVLVVIYAQQRGPGSTYVIGSWTAYQRTVTLRQSVQSGEEFYVSVRPLQDGNVTVEIIDSSQSVTNSIHVFVVSPWFLLLCFATLVLDAYVFVRWFRVRGSIRRTRLDGIDEKGLADELEVSRTYLVLSWIRKLKSRLLKRREKSEVS